MTLASSAASGVVPMLQNWAEIKDDFSLNWFIYLSMPFIAAIIGYVTKVVALEMLYRPLEFKGIGPLGWQGLVPRRAGKVAAVAFEKLTERVLKPEELLDRIDAREAVTQLREPLIRSVDEIGREMAEQLRPGLWDSLPEQGRALVLSRVESAAPQVVDRVLDAVRNDMPRYLDLQHMSVTVLVTRKERLNDLMRGVSGPATDFVRRSGIYFGFGIGLIQLVAWATVHNVWIMPAFGFFTGFISDYVALTMLFRPMRPRRILGIKMHGVLHAQRDQVTRDYARLMANDILAPKIMLDAILEGPSSDLIFATLEREVSAAIDAELGVARPLVAVTIGSERYAAVKAGVFELVRTRVPELLEDVETYAARALDVENLIYEKMCQLSEDAYEAILRPVFKDDEMLMVAVGAVLGFLVGELQVQMVEHLSRS